MKGAPASFQPLNECNPACQTYKYFVSGKGCTLGVLFEDSTHVYFEWLSEGGRRVSYGPELRYHFWPKREFARLMHAGVWEPAAELAV